jgi:hypothetical protein
MNIGRPEAHEAAEYYWGYIGQAMGDDPVAVLEAQIAEVAALSAQFSEERSLYRYAEGKWSVREALSHVTDTERVFTFRALWFGRGFTEALPAFDQNTGVLGAEADRLSWAQHVEEFRQVRAATIPLFRNMPEEAWGRIGMASGKPVSVRALAFITAGHTAHHFRILRERYLG